LIIPFFLPGDPGYVFLGYLGLAYLLSAYAWITDVEPVRQIRNTQTNGRLPKK